MKAEYKMRRITIKSVIAIITFIIGIVSVGIWFTKISTDSTVYSAKFCDLHNEPSRYDGKIVRIQATHGGLGIDTPASITDSDCNDWARFVCKMDGNSCYQMNMKIRSIKLGKVRIDAIGRYTADTKDPDWDSRERQNVHLFEITELKGIESLE